MYIIWKVVYFTYIELCVFFKDLDIKFRDLAFSVFCEKKCPHIKQLCTIEYTWLCILFQKLCILNIKNCVSSLKNCVCWIYRIVNIFWTLRYLRYRLYTLNNCKENCLHITFLKNFVYSMYKIFQKMYTIMYI